MFKAYVFGRLLASSDTLIGLYAQLYDMGDPHGVYIFSPDGVELD